MDMTTIKELATEYGMQSHELIAWADIGFAPDDTVLPTEAVDMIREAMAQAPESRPS
jgi:hypothetical protein